MTEIHLKLKNYQNIPKPIKWQKYLHNLKITKIPPKTKKWLKYPWNLKMAKIPPKPKNVRNTPKSIIYSFTERLKIEFLYKNGVAQVYGFDSGVLVFGE